MSDEFAKGYLFLDSLYKNADSQRKQHEIDRLREEVNKPRMPGATGIPVVPGMVNKADYDLLREKVAYYEALLAQPLHVIASSLLNKISSFSENYEKEELVLADWIASQKAFKEVAMKYGELAGKSADEIHREGTAAKVTVLTNKTKYENNIDGHEFANSYAVKLRAKLGL